MSADDTPEVLASQVRGLYKEMERVRESILGLSDTVQGFLREASKIEAVNVQIAAFKRDQDDLWAECLRIDTKIDKEIAARNKTTADSLLELVRMLVALGTGIFLTYIELRR